MDARNKKKLKKLNVLEISKHERTQLIKEVREKLRQKTIETKLSQSLLEAENLTINGNIMCKSNQLLHGFKL